jgi:hypothetical protein
MGIKMSFIGNVLGKVTGASQAGKAAERAGQTQAAASQAGIEEQRRQFDALVELMSPYVQAGTGAMARLAPYEQAGQQAFGQQQALVGLQGPQAQQQAMAGFEQSPLFQSLMQQGEGAILQNASATGGLRGGDVQAALSQFRPQLLNSLIEQQYGRLGGIAGTGLGVTTNLFNTGQASAAGQAGAGMQSASNVGNLLANQAQAIAGGQMARGNVGRQTFGDLLSIGTMAAGAGGFGGAGAGAGAGGAPVGGSGISFKGF